MTNTKKSGILAIALFTSMTLFSCTPGERGAVTGGALGAGAGALIGGGSTGALIGGAVGAVAGSEISKKRSARNRYYDHRRY